LNSTFSSNTEASGGSDNHAYANPVRTAIGSGAPPAFQGTLPDQVGIHKNQEFRRRGLPGPAKKRRNPGA
jgi:hypothetical protein